jgi:hypothetical protein
MHSVSARFEPKISDVESLSPSGRFDLETWTCQAKAFYPTFDFSVLGRQCVLESSARWLSLVIFVLSLALLAICWVDWKGKALVISKKLDQGDCEDSEDDWV